jgi:hypothetical protein
MSEDPDLDIERTAYWLGQHPWQVQGRYAAAFWTRRQALYWLYGDRTRYEEQADVSEHIWELIEANPERAQAALHGLVHSVSVLLNCCSKAEESKEAAIRFLWTTQDEMESMSDATMIQIVDPEDL